mmetsp:Transcript_4507/g.9993  ORF Transcript_4507/g.9993 Transcript_4507/m.9993 type:complete len:97 (+) Transcript_4507:1205-1495(+)
MRERMKMTLKMKINKERSIPAWFPAHTNKTSYICLYSFTVLTKVLSKRCANMRERGRVRRNGKVSPLAGMEKVGAYKKKYSSARYLKNNNVQRCAC